MASSAKSLAARLLLRLAHAIYFHRGWFIYSQALLVAACLFYTVWNLEFLTNRSALVGAEKEYHRLYQEFRQEFPIQDDLVVVVESEDLEKNRQFVERLGAKLETETNLFTGVFYKGDLALMGPKALLFLPEENLRDLGKTLQDYRPFLSRFCLSTNLVSLFNTVNAMFRSASREANQENEALAKALPALERIVSQAADGFERLGKPPSPGIDALFEEGPEAEGKMYITFADGRIYLVTAQAARENEDRAVVTRLRELVEETKLEVPGLNVGVTGEPVLEIDEMAQSQRDTILATSVSLLAVSLIFIYGYHETGRPLKATVCLLVGLVYTIAFTTATVGHLNILTITFVPILIGLAIDFGVHLITRYEEELRHGRSERAALEKAMMNTGLGIFTGAFTTAGAFFAMVFADFKGVQEMGIICGGGMLVCLVPMLTLLPALLLQGRQNILDHEQAGELDQQETIEIERRARWEGSWMHHRGIAIAATLVLMALAATQISKVRFDYNLLNMQSDGLPAVVFQDKLVESSDRSVLFGAVIASSAIEATNLMSRITNLSTVSSVDTMATYLTEDQSGKLRLLREIKETVGSIRFPPLDEGPTRVRDFSRALWSLHGYAGLALRVVPADDPLRGDLEKLRESISRLLHAIMVGEREDVVGKLTGFQQSLFADVRGTFLAIQNQDDSGPLRETDLPEALRRRFIGISGKHLLQVYPKENIWERAGQEKFIKELRQIEPKATGTPVQLYEYTKLLKQSYEQAACYSLLAIAILVFVHFRRISCVVLALVPVGVGALWTIGLMGLCNIPFNPANIMTLPLIVGIGVTNGIHILNRFAEEDHPSILATSTGKAVLVSGLTTMSGFGSLMLAQHRGIQSLGYIMTAGVCSCLVVGLTFLPALLDQLSQRGWTIKRTQRDNARSTLGREEPR